MALDQRERLGCVGVVTDAETEVVAFYQALGFSALDDVGEGLLVGEPLPMFLGIETRACDRARLVTPRPQKTSGGGGFLDGHSRVQRRFRGPLARSSPANVDPSRALRSPNHRHRSRRVGRRPVAELTAAVGPPALNRSVR